MFVFLLQKRKLQYSYESRAHNLTFLAIFLRNFTTPLETSYTQGEREEEEKHGISWFTYDTIAISSDIGGTEIFLSIDRQENANKYV